MHRFHREETEMGNGETQRSERRLEVSKGRTKKQAGKGKKKGKGEGKG